MPRKHVVLPFVAALAAIVMAGCATTQRGPAEWDGLVRQPNTRLDAVFLKPDAEIPSYTSIILAPASVQFARNWDPNRGGRSMSRRLNAGDVVAIKDNLSAMLGDIFREELTAGGYVASANVSVSVANGGMTTLSLTSSHSQGDKTYTINAAGTITP